MLLLMLYYFTILPLCKTSQAKIMDEWEFMRRPARPEEKGSREPAKVEKKCRKEMEPIKVTIVFGGTKKTFLLSPTDTFEDIYKDYETRFNTAFNLRCKEDTISRYIKAKAAVDLFGPAPLVLEAALMPKSVPQPIKPTTYMLRYTPYDSVEVERTDEIKIGELLETAKRQIKDQYNITLQPSYIVFNGDILLPEDKIDSVLMDKDLLDIVDKNLLN